jgi:hypothetical protein
MYMHVYANAFLLQDARTPLGVALRFARIEMAALLRQHGGK